MNIYLFSAACAQVVGISIALLSLAICFGICVDLPAFTSLSEKFISAGGSVSDIVIAGASGLIISTIVAVVRAVSKGS